MSSLFYRQLGKGYPVILIHGFCETHEIWNGFADKLAEKFEVFAIDLPGFGTSSGLNRPFSIEDVAVQVTNWIGSVNLQSPVIIGHSLGGYVTLAMAKKFPDRFAGIGLFQSTAYDDSEERKANRNKVIEFVKSHGVNPYIDTFVPGLFADKKNPSISEADRIARKTIAETLISYAEAMRDRPSSADFLKSYLKPVLILGGQKDTIISKEITIAHGKLIKNAKVHLIQNVGHMAMYENPKEALEIVQSFALEIEKNMTT
jgi:pimeloyl-ACP methyl ester carboxylesterase